MRPLCWVRVVPMSKRWSSSEEMLRLAANGVRKVDTQGTRGITLVTHEEIAAMAAVIALSDAAAYLHGEFGKLEQQQGQE